MIVRALAYFLILALPGCNKDDGDTTTDGGTGTGTFTAGTTDAPTTSTGTGTAGTTSTPTSGVTTGSTDATATGTDPGTSSEPSTGSTTGVDVSGFERFKQSYAAGPCPPNTDCDGFTELLASGLLRVETFGDVTNEVKEIQISAEDLTAAVLVFADPALVALLDGSDPVCDPPTDIFETMLVVIDKGSHDLSTTGCEDPPVAAARNMADELRTKYMP